MIIIGIPSMVRSCLRSREVPQHSLLGSPCRIIESRPRRQWQPANNEHASAVRWCFIRPRLCLLRGGVGRTSQFGGMKLFSVGWSVGCRNSICYLARGPRSQVVSKVQSCCCCIDSIDKRLRWWGSRVGIYHNTTRSMRSSLQPYKVDR